MMWDGWAIGHDEGWFSYMFVHLVWWLLLIAGVATLWRFVLGRGHGGRLRDDRAVEILRERYARGEIDQAEYDERLRRLRG